MSLIAHGLRFLGNILKNGSTTTYPVCSHKWVWGRVGCREAVSNRLLAQGKHFYETGLKKIYKSKEAELKISKKQFFLTKEIVRITNVKETAVA